MRREPREWCFYDVPLSPRGVRRMSITEAVSRFSGYSELRTYVLILGPIAASLFVVVRGFFWLNRMVRQLFGSAV
jgi:hypothetical protein